MADGDIDIEVNATDNASGVLSGIAEGIAIAFGEKILDAVGGVFTFVYDQLSQFVSMAGEAEEVGALFASTLAGSPLAAYGDELQDLAQKLQDLTRFEDESILSAETVILRYNEIGHDVFPRVTATALDLAETMKTTAEGGAQMLGRALSDIANGSLSALKRTRLLDQGILDQAEAMAKAGDAAGAQTLILDALDKKIGNVAETMAGTWNGAIQKFGIAIDNIKEELGGKLLPIFTPLVSKFQTLAERYAPLLGKVFDTVLVPGLVALVDRIVPLVDTWIPRIMDGLSGLFELSAEIGVFGQLGDALQELLNGNFEGFVNGINSVFRDIGNTIKNTLGIDVSVLFAPIKNGIDAFGAFWFEQGPAIQKIAQDTFSKLGVIFVDLGEKVLPWLAQKFDELGRWFLTNGPLITQVIQRIADMFVFFVQHLVDAWPVLAAVLDGLFAGFGRLATMIMQVFTGDIGGAFETWKGGFSKTFEDVGAIISAFGDWIGGFFGTTWAQTTAQWGAFFSGLGAMVSYRFAALQNSILLFMVNIAGDIAAKIDEIKYSFTAGVSNWIDAVSDKISEFSNVGSAIVSAIQAGISGSWAAFESWITGKIQSIIDALLAAVGLGGAGGEMGNINTRGIIPSSTFAGGSSGASGGGGSSPGFGGGTTYNFGPVTQMFSGKPNSGIYGAG